MKGAEESTGAHTEHVLNHSSDGSTILGELLFVGRNTPNLHGHEMVGLTCAKVWPQQL